MVTNDFVQAPDDRFVQMYLTYGNVPMKQCKDNAIKAWDDSGEKWAYDHRTLVKGLTILASSCSVTASCQGFIWLWP